MDRRDFLKTGLIAPPAILVRDYSYKDTVQAYVNMYPLWAEGKNETSRDLEERIGKFNGLVQALKIPAPTPDQIKEVLSLMIQDNIIHQRSDEEFTDEIVDDLKELGIIENAGEMTDKLFESRLEYKRGEESANAGIFVTKLIGSSYSNGADTFHLQTDDTKLHLLGGYLQANPGRLIKLEIEGDVGSRFGYKARHLEATISKNAENRCGELSNNCDITINGNIGELAGYKMSGGKLEVYGEVGCESESDQYRATNTQFVFHKDPELARKATEVNS